MKTVQEALFVVGLAIIVAFVVNASVNPHPLPWLHEEREVTSTSDASLDSLLGLTTGAVNQGTTGSNPVPNQVTGGSGMTSQVNSPSSSSGIPASVSVTAPKNSMPSSSASTPTTGSPSIAAKNTATSPSSTPNNGAVATNAAATPAGKLPLSVNYEQVLKLLNTAGVTFIDARKVEEHEKAALKGSLNVDMVQFPEDPTYRDKSMRLLYSLPKDHPVVAYCGGGNCELSHELCDVLIQMGFSKVFIYLGGWGEYSEKQGLGK